MTKLVKLGVRMSRNHVKVVGLLEEKYNIDTSRIVEVVIERGSRTCFYQPSARFLYVFSRVSLNRAM